jgi:1-acyl-sn-glycerol-3-phosphate acyltransferase
MIWLRSILFNVAFYIVLTVVCIVALPTLIMPYMYVVRVAKFWGQINLWLLNVICNVKYEFRGFERAPKGALLVAAKHQSVWETFALFNMFDDPLYILKRELMWIPLFGWYTWKARMVAVDRSKGSQALTDMIARAKAEIGGRRQIIIFPEGTRRPAGAEPKYKYGVVHLYEALGVPCLPVALNSGVFWPRRTLLRYPGTVVVEMLQPIPPGLDRDEFFQRLQNTIEPATARLVEAGRDESVSVQA